MYKLHASRKVNRLLLDEYNNVMKPCCTFLAHPLNVASVMLLNVCMFVVIKGKSYVLILFVF